MFRLESSERHRYCSFNSNNTIAEAYAMLRNQSAIHRQVPFLLAKSFFIGLNQMRGFIKPH